MHTKRLMFLLASLQQTLQNIKVDLQHRLCWQVVCATVHRYWGSDLFPKTCFLGWGKIGRGWSIL